MQDLGAALSQLIGPLRRSLLRVTRSIGGLPDVPDAQIELLRALSDAVPRSPGALAEELGLARSTISNLSKSMVASGLIERALDHSDARSTTLSPSDHALRLLERYDDASAALLTEVIAQLPDADRESLAAALPALLHLRDALDIRFRKE